MATKTSRTVGSGGVNLVVHERGDADAPTVVLVHGYPDTSAVWEPVAEILKQRFHVVTYDVRGAGESDRPQQRSAYRLDLLAQDLFAVVDATSPDRPVHVVGHDWGSTQSWEAVTDDRAASRIASFTSVSGPCLDHLGHWTRSHRRLRDLPALLNQMRKSWYVALFHLPVLTPLAWRTWLGKGFGPMVERMEGIPHSDDYPAPTLARDGAVGIQLYRANVLPRLRNPRQRRTTVPVQVIVPVKDRYILPAVAAGAPKPWVDRLWVRKVQTGHWLPRKDPETMARAVTELIDHAEGGREPDSMRRLRATRDAPREFDNRLVVVTGAGSGIGRETALAFANLGASVVVADINGDAADETAAMVRGVGVAAYPYVVDVSNVDAMEDFAKRVLDSQGVPDVVVNNAGIGIAGPFLDTTADDWERIVDINLLGVVHGCRLFGRAMVDRREGGHIVNIASAAAFLPSRTLGAYATTKAAVLMLSESIRAEFVDAGVGVSAICPGIVNTNITTSAHYVGVSSDEENARRQRMAKQYARRNYPPSKVAAAVVKAVRTNSPVVPVTPEAAGAYVLSKVWPGALRRLARVDPL